MGESRAGKEGFLEEASQASDPSTWGDGESPQRDQIGLWDGMTPATCLVMKAISVLCGHRRGRQREPGWHRSGQRHRGDSAGGVSGSPSSGSPSQRLVEAGATSPDCRCPCSGIAGSLQSQALSV